VRGELAIGGELRVRGYGEVGGHALYGIALASLDRHRMVVMEQELLGDPAGAAAQLTGVEAIAEVDDSGAVVTLHLPAESPELAAHLLPLLISGLEVRTEGAPADDGWRAEGQAPFGTAVTRYRVGDDGAVTRSRERYTRLAIAAEGAGAATVG
jgi:hypothetical protein